MTPEVDMDPQLHYALASSGLGELREAGVQSVHPGFFYRLRQKGSVLRGDDGKGT